MTTIAYRDKMMAADSCLSSGEESMRYVGDVVKIFRLKDGSLFGASGDGECQAIINVLESGIPDHEIAATLAAEVQLECECILVRPDGRTFWIVTGDGYGEFTNFNDKFCACGTGQDFAYGAMEHGATALEAVQCAAKRHNFTRGPFMSVSLMDGNNRV